MRPSKHSIQRVVLLVIVLACCSGEAAAKPPQAATPVMPDGMASPTSASASADFDPSVVLNYWTQARLDAATASPNDVATSTGVPAPSDPGAAQGSVGSGTAALVPVPVIQGLPAASPPPKQHTQVDQPTRPSSSKQGTHCTSARGKRVCVTRDARGRKTKRCVTAEGTKTCTSYGAKSGKALRTCITRAGKTSCRKVRALAAAATLGTWGFAAAPLPAVGRITFHTDKGDSLCSGTLITADTVVTAAHCVMTRPAPNVATLHSNLIFMPGMSGTLQSNGTYTTNFSVYGRYVVDRVDYFNSYIAAPDDMPDVPVDYALMHLSTPVPASVGTFPVRWDTGQTLGQEVWRYGYPGEGFWGTAAGGNQMFQVLCQTTLDGFWVRPDYNLGIFMTLECPSNGGSSGGPVFRQAADGSWAVIGVMSRCARDANMYCTTNSAPYFSADFGVLWNHYLAGGGITPPSVG